MDGHADAFSIVGTGKGISNVFVAVIKPTCIVSLLSGADDCAQRCFSTGRPRHIHASRGTAAVSGIVARGKHTDAIRILFTEVLRHDLAKGSAAVTVIHIVAVTVAHHNRLAHAVGIVADALERVGNASVGHAIQAAQV